MNGKTQRLRYRYTAGGKLDQVLLPSGKLVTYDYTQGVLTGVGFTMNGDKTALINNLQYQPAGVSQFTWAQSNQTVNYVYDMDGRLQQLNDAQLNRTYAHDVLNRIIGITDSKARVNQTFEYDALNRLTQQQLGVSEAGSGSGTGSSSITVQSLIRYGYDNNSNRTLQTIIQNGNTTTQSWSILPNSNRIGGYGYDASGKILNDSTRSITYNTEGRSHVITRTVQNNGTNQTIRMENRYNALGQRVRKRINPNNNNSGSLTFAYYENGALAGEYNADGKVLREYIYLGNRPIALYSRENPGQVLHIHTDHLTTPRAVSDKDNKILWRWEGDAFGDVKPQLETITLPLRMAGQYFDKESALFYNYFRDYNPATGRYMQNDPIGLAGGMNRFGYVAGNPLSYVDPFGLFSTLQRCLATPVNFRSCTASGEFSGAITQSMASAGKFARAAAKAFTRAQANCQGNKDCGDLKMQIDMQVSSLKRRHSDMLEDRNRLYQSWANQRKKSGTVPPNSWPGHQLRFYVERANLVALIAQADSVGCGHVVSEEARTMATKSAPNRPNNY